MKQTEEVLTPEMLTRWNNLLQKRQSVGHVVRVCRPPCTWTLLGKAQPKWDDYQVMKEFILVPRLSMGFLK